MSETGSPARSHHSRRQLRERKQRKLYLEEWALGDDEMEGTRGFSVAEKLESSKFAQTGMVREMKGSDLTVAFLQQYGFNIPLLFRDKSGLGIQMPPSEFDVHDVRLCVGSRRILDVMDVNTQKNLQMTMKEWQQYYENPQKDRLLNVISLEFSHTRLANFIESPEIVRQIDWVDVVWPKQLKDAQKEGTNVLGEMMYPKVQKYCLMSVKNCYTDFHIDFGGTSVWYHILKGSKVFWLIPPTEKNLQLYEKWVLSGKQSDIFFGDTVEKCARVYLTAGNTFFIPTGWIHAVYTPTESLVFGGNFLHSFGIVKQLKTAQVEDSTKVPQKFRYPFFTEMLWYVLARYVFTLLGRSHLDGESSLSEEEMCQKGHLHLTHYELFGLKEIVMYLYDLPPQKKNVPDLVRDPVALIKDVRTLVERHCKDKPELAITGCPVLKPQTEIHSTFHIYDRFKVKEQIKLEISRKNEELMNDQQNMTTTTTTTTTTPTLLSCENTTDNGNDIAITPIKQELSSNGYSAVGGGALEKVDIDDVSNFVSPTISSKSRHPKKNALNVNAAASQQAVSPGGAGPGGGGVAGGGTSSSGTEAKVNHCVTGGGQPRRRRTRCKICAACQRSDCGECSFCLDMVKFGGPGRAKQTCMMRQCLSPMLPVTAQCVYCHLDGWKQTPVSPQAKLQASLEGPSALMECSVCYEIAHPDCAQSQSDEMKGIVNEDLPNSWECPSCCKSGKNTDYKAVSNVNTMRPMIYTMVLKKVPYVDSILEFNFFLGEEKEELMIPPIFKRCVQRADRSDLFWKVSERHRIARTPRHFRARLKSSEVRRTSVSSDANSTAADGARHNYHLDRENGGLQPPPLQPPIGQYNDFVFTSESEMESSKNHNHTVKRKQQQHHQLMNIKTERLDASGCSDGVSSSTTYKVGKGTATTFGINTNTNDNNRLSAVCTIKRRKSEDGGGGSFCGSIQESADNPEVISISLPRKKSSIRSQLAQQMLNSSTRVLKKPQHVVRPAQAQPLHSQSNSNLALDQTLLKMIFRYLSPESLVTCCSVCKIWSNVSVDPDLWKTMNCAEHKLSAALLTAIVRRQPEHLILDWTQIAKRQLAWVIARLPALKNLSLQNCPIQAVLALHTCLCPPLQILDLSFVRGLNDSAIRDILSAPKDSRPGLTDSKSRLRNLKTLKIAGTDISDVALRYITQGLPMLIHLDLSSCQRVTDAGVAQIGTCSSAINTLVELNLSACRLVTELSLDHLSKCEQLVWLDLRHVPQVTTQAVIKFAAKSKHDLCVKDIKLVERRYASSNHHY